MLLQAVCCSDKEHCCPNGYTCDVSAGSCTQDAHSISWNSVAVRNVDKPSPNDFVCPDGTSECPDGTTCCLMQSGDYGCCPYPQVCIGCLTVSVCHCGFLVLNCCSILSSYCVAVCSWIVVDSNLAPVEAVCGGICEKWETYLTATTRLRLSRHISLWILLVIRLNARLRNFSYVFFLRLCFWFVLYVECYCVIFIMLTFLLWCWLYIKCSTV